MNRFFSTERINSIFLTLSIVGLSFTGAIGILLVVLGCALEQYGYVLCKTETRLHLLCIEFNIIKLTIIWRITRVCVWLDLACYTSWINPEAQYAVTSFYILMCCKCRRIFVAKFFITGVECITIWIRENCLSLKCFNFKLLMTLKSSYLTIMK